MKALPTAFLFLLTALSGRAQENAFYSETLINEILADTNVDDHYLQNDILELVEAMRQDKGDFDLMFPFIIADSVVLYTFNKDIPLYLEYLEGETRKAPYHLFDNNGLKTELDFDYRDRLTEKEVDEFLHVLNDTRNFEWSGVIGPNFAKALFAFYKDGEIRSYVRLNSLGQIACNPTSRRIKYGAVTERAQKWFNLFLKGKVPSFWKE
jgi:hypothetical protein